MSGNKPRPVPLLTALLLALVGASAAMAAPGDRDPSFGNDGAAVLETPPPIIARYHDVMTLPDGSILAAGGQ